MTQVVNLHFRLEVDSNQNIPNPVDICKLLNQLLRTNDPLKYGKVVGYNVKFDDIIPFYNDDEEHIDLSLEENAEWDNFEVMEED